MIEESARPRRGNASAPPPVAPKPRDMNGIYKGKLLNLMHKIEESNRARSDYNIDNQLFYRVLNRLPLFSAATRMVRPFPDAQRRRIYESTRMRLADIIPPGSEFTGSAEDFFRRRYTPRRR